MGLHTSVKVLQCDVIRRVRRGRRSSSASAPGTPVQKAVRVRSTREGPLSHITTHVPQVIAAQLRPPRTREEADPDAARGVRRRDRPRRADASRRGWPTRPWPRCLGVEVGSALLAVQPPRSSTCSERPVQWLQGLYRPDRYHYEMQLSRVGSIDAKVWVSKDLSAQFH